MSRSGTFPHAKQRRSILVLTLAILLAVIAAPPMFNLGPFVVPAKAIESQRPPVTCSAVGNNWTSCGNAVASDNVYANASDWRGPTQFARPDSDIAVVNWTDSANDGVNYTKIDEPAPPDDEGTFTRTRVGPDNADDAEFGLSDVVDPQASEGHLLRYRFRSNWSNAGGNANLSVRVDLKQGVSVFASWNEFNIVSTSYVTQERPLTVQQADNISDYSDLQVKFDVTFIPGSQNRSFQLTWLEFEVPGLPMKGKNDTAWYNFGFNLDPEDTVNSVDVGVEWFRTSSEPILNVTISWDGGSSWAANVTATNKSADDGQVEWLNFTAATTWDPAKLSNANLRVRVGTNASDARLDYVVVRVNYNAAPELSDWQLVDASGLSKAGQELEIDRPYYFTFNVTDDDGWTDIGSDGSVSVRLWYDGNVTPELNWNEQTNGSNFRLELRYQDLGDPGNATLDEWRLVEGSGFYNASDSVLIPITNGSTLVGYRFNLSLKLGFHVKAATSPTNNTPGGYNDPGSWNVEIVVGDGLHLTTLQTVSSGAHLEFGVRAVPLLEYSALESETAIPPGGPVVFTLRFNNTGQGVATTVWVNATLAAELLYQNDTASSIGGSVSGNYSFSFTNVAPGNNSFNLTVTAAGQVPNGTVVLNDFSFESVNGTGSPLNRTLLVIPITINNAILSLTLSSNKAAAKPGDTIALTVTIRNTGATNATGLYVEATLDTDATYIPPSSPVANYQSNNRTLNWSFSSISPGAPISVQWSIEVRPGTPDAEKISTTVFVDSWDLSGSQFPRLARVMEATVESPIFTVGLILNRDRAERGDVVQARFWHNNTGSGIALRAWANWTFATDFELDSTAPPQCTSSVAGLTCQFFNVSGGNRSISLNIKVRTGLDDGLQMPVGVLWQATDGNGNFFPDTSIQKRVELEAPVILLSARGPTRVEPGALFSLDLTIRNTGQATAIGWLNLTLPQSVSFEGFNGTLPVTQDDERRLVSWTVGSVLPGQSLELDMRFRSVGAAAGSFRFTMEFTDGKGSDPIPSFSNFHNVDFPQPSSFIPDWLIWILIGATAAIVGYFLVYRRLFPGLSIEEVFVVHKNGILVAHRSRTLTPDQDEDILAAMLKTVQDFVQDAFSSREEAPMRSLQFEKFRIMIEQGTNHYIAVVFQGKEDALLRRRLTRLSKRIEEEYAAKLKAWAGDLRELRGIKDLIPVLWGKRGPQDGKESRFDARTLLSSLRRIVPRRREGVKEETPREKEDKET